MRFGKASNSTLRSGSGLSSQHTRTGHFYHPLDIILVPNMRQENDFVDSCRSQSGDLGPGCGNLVQVRGTHIGAGRFQRFVANVNPHHPDGFARHIQHSATEQVARLL